MCVCLQAALLWGCDTMAQGSRAASSSCPATRLPSTERPAAGSSKCMFCCSLRDSCTCTALPIFLSLPELASGPLSLPELASGPQAGLHWPTCGSGIHEVAAAPKPHCPAAAPMRLCQVDRGRTNVCRHASTAGMVVQLGLRLHSLRLLLGKQQGCAQAPPPPHLHFVALLAVRLGEAMQHEMAVDDARGEQALAGVNVHVLRRRRSEGSAVFLANRTLTCAIDMHAPSAGRPAAKCAAGRSPLCPKLLETTYKECISANDSFRNSLAPFRRPPPPPPAWRRQVAAAFFGVRLLYSLLVICRLSRATMHQ